MNILLIAHERNLGGASKSLVTLADELQRRGNKVVVIVPFKNGQVYKKLKELNILTYKIFFGWWMMPEYWSMPLKVAFRILDFFKFIPAGRIAKIAEKEEIQVIHSNSSAIDVGAIAAKKAGIPHVWHFREFGDADYQLEFLKGRKKSCDFIENSGSKVIFISKALRNHYKDDISDKISQVIYNGISPEFIVEKNYEQEIQKPIFLIAGNLHRNKGQNIALKAAKILQDRGITNFELWIAGQPSAMKDSQKYEIELKNYSKENLKDCCKFLGFVSNMKELRKKTDVELVCSNKEAFGRVTVEAMLAGNPVIGTDSGANIELIEDKCTGRLVENGNEADMADKMQWFIEDTSRISECGKNALGCARKKFLSSKNTENIECLYKELIV